MDLSGAKNAWRRQAFHVKKSGVRIANERERRFFLANLLEGLFWTCDADLRRRKGCCWMGELAVGEGLDKFCIRRCQLEIWHCSIYFASAWFPAIALGVFSAVAMPELLALRTQLSNSCALWANSLRGAFS